MAMVWYRCAWLFTTTAPVPSGSQAEIYVVANYEPSSSKRKALHRAWLDFRELARAIRGQTDLLKSVKTNTPMDVPDSWLGQLEELRVALDVLHQEVLQRAADIPSGAHPRVLRERDETLSAMEAEFRALFEQLFGGVQHVRTLLNDPTRTATEFSGSFLDYLGAAADFLRMKIEKASRRKNKK